MIQIFLLNMNKIKNKRKNGFIKIGQNDEFIIKTQKCIEQLTPPFSEHIEENKKNKWKGIAFTIIFRGSY